MVEGTWLPGGSGRGSPSRPTSFGEQEDSEAIATWQRPARRRRAGGAVEEGAARARRGEATGWASQLGARALPRGGAESGTSTPVTGTLTFASNRAGRSTCPTRRRRRRSFQVLEDVWDLDWYSGECLRVLKPGGWLLLSTHGSWPIAPAPPTSPLDSRWAGGGAAVARAPHRAVAARRRPPGLDEPAFRLLGLGQVLRRLPVVGPPLLVPITLLTNLPWSWRTPSLPPRCAERQRLRLRHPLAETRGPPSVSHAAPRS